MTLITWPKPLDSYYARSEALKPMNVMGLTPPPAIGRGVVAHRRLGISRSFRRVFIAIFWVRQRLRSVRSALRLTRPRAVGVPAGTEHRQHRRGELHRRHGQRDGDLEHRQRHGRRDPRCRRDAARRRHVVGDRRRRRSRKCVYRVTNTGNGPETFRLVHEQRDRAATISIRRRPRRLSTSTPTRAATCRPATRRTVGSNDPMLNADAFVTVLVVNDIPGGGRRRQHRHFAA